MSESVGCCKCCLSLILTVGLTALFLWLALRANNPSCSVKSFYLPALNRSLGSPGNATIFMDLILKNGNKEKGIYYDQINVTVRSFNHSNNASWEGMIPGFRQGYNKKAPKRVSMVTTGVNWTAMAMRNETAVFQVDLSTKVRFRILFYKTKRHKLAVRTNVTVNELGAYSSGQDLRCHCKNVGIFLSLLAFGFLNI